MNQKQEQKIYLNPEETTPIVLNSTFGDYKILIILGVLKIQNLKNFLQSWQ